jgi:large subunit ribosomal protein L13
MSLDERGVGGYAPPSREAGGAPIEPDSGVPPPGSTIILENPEMKTYSAKPGEVEKKWHVVDVSGLVLGRAATKIADLLRGKHKPEFTHHTDTGDFVIVVNAEKVRLTGKKWTDKIYSHHTGYPGGLRQITAEKQREKDPTFIIREAVWGMIPKTKLGKAQIKKLKIYAGPDHPHQAQTPAPVAQAKSA